MKSNNKKKERLYRIPAVILYLILLGYVGGFSVRGMLDVRGLAAVALGMLLFSLPQIREFVLQKSCSTVQFWNGIAYNGMMSGFLTAVLFLLAHLSETQTGEGVLTQHVTRMLSSDLRPILYGLCVYTVLHSEEKTPIAAPEKYPSHDELYLYFQRSGLTNRETELAILVYQGYSNRDIAEECYISEATVKKHMTHIFEKLGIARREELQNIRLQESE